MKRREKINYYLDIAQTVSERSTCLRRCYGAVIVKNDTIISTGYNGSPRGRKNCCDTGKCIRESKNVPHGERYELCVSVHAEQNAIISASRDQMIGATLYLCCTSPTDHEIISDTDCCMMCKRVILNSGISTVIIRDTSEKFRTIAVSEWLNIEE